MSIDSGVTTCLRIAARRALAALAITGGLATIAAPLANADDVADNASVEAPTPSASNAHLASQRNGSVDPGSLPASVCSARGLNVQGVSATAVPASVVTASVETGAVDVAVPECNSVPASANASRSTGRTQGVNPGSSGQCTWGAAQKWFEASGSYPALAGDAMSWSDAAAAGGWTVTDDAQDRSIVVFKPGVAGAGSIGHVAWVDSVSDLSDGRWIHVTEMNNSYLGGVGVFNDRDVKDVPGMSYILLPR